MKLIAQIVCYEDEGFIEATLKSLVNTISDLDGIDIADGAWLNGGTNAHSQDRTKILCHFFHKENKIDVKFRETDQIFENESAKRNYHLRKIEDDYGEDTVILVIDADEYVKFPNGLEKIELKELVSTNLIGLIDAYAVGRKEVFRTPRIIPMGYDFHYHTKRSMIVHSHKCLAEFDYNLENQKKKLQSNMNCYYLNDLIIVNRWTERPPARMTQKLKYCQFQEDTEQKLNEKCDYK